MNENAMPINVPGGNRHVVDQLALVRQCIKDLKEREDELKEAVSRDMGSADHLGGDEFVARQTLTERKGGLDEKAMKAAGIDVEKFRKKPSTVMSIRVDRRAVDEMDAAGSVF